jgi:hypothetical protein
VAVGCLGAHYALSKEQSDELCDLGEYEEWSEFLERLDETIEEEWFLYGDKFWDGLHRCLTDGRLETGYSDLHAVILGHINWYEGESYHIHVLEPGEAQRTIDAMEKIDRAWLRERYKALDQEECDWQLGDEDFEKHWLYFERVRAFFKRAVQANRWVIFTVNF